MKHRIVGIGEDYLPVHEISTIAEMAITLEHAGYNDWIEGLGMPMCEADIRMWHAMGHFLAKREEQCKAAEPAVDSPTTKQLCHERHLTDCYSDMSKE